MADWNDTIAAYGTAEALYQAFKARLMRECEEAAAKRAQDEARFFDDVYNDSQGY